MGLGFVLGPGAASFAFILKKKKTNTINQKGALFAVNVSASASQGREHVPGPAQSRRAPTKRSVARCLQAPGVPPALQSQPGSWLLGNDPSAGGETEAESWETPSSCSSHGAGPRFPVQSLPTTGQLSEGSLFFLSLHIPPSFPENRAATPRGK